MAQHAQPNVNVTWGSDGSSPPRTFPCPICAARLDLRQSRANKPYCVCNSCGIQVFFRGKTGIARLREFLTHEQPSQRLSAAAAASLIAFGRLERLRAEKEELERKRPLFFSDKPLESAIAAVEHEIAHLQVHLDVLAQGSKATGTPK
jgi:DNA-directed RNA polymerase subunit RPC12/RpoP